MTRDDGWLKRVGTAARAIGTVNSGPVPRAAMLRSGGAIGLGFVGFLAFGDLQAASLCAVFVNLLCLADKASDLRTRLLVQLTEALLSTLAGLIGTLLAGNDIMIMTATLAFAVAAGLVHGSLPGIESVPRFALVCFIVAAFVPVAQAGTLWVVGLGTLLALATVALDHHIRHGRRGLLVERYRGVVRYPGPRFSLIYGVAAACGLAIGLRWEQTRPYWVTVTTLFVMQPDRRANTVRVLQRFLGTLVGVMLAFVLVRLIPSTHRTQGLLVLIVILPFVWPLGFDRNYALGVAILSAWVLILIDATLPPSSLIPPLFLARLSDTAIGCAIALVGSFVVYEATEPAHP